MIIKGPGNNNNYPAAGQFFKTIVFIIKYIVKQPFWGPNLGHLSTSQRGPGPKFLVIIKPPENNKNYPGAGGPEIQNF